MVLMVVSRMAPPVVLWETTAVSWPPLVGKRRPRGRVGSPPCETTDLHLAAWGQMTHCPNVVPTSLLGMGGLARELS